MDSEIEKLLSFAYPNSKLEYQNFEGDEFIEIWHENSVWFDYFYQMTDNEPFEKGNIYSNLVGNIIINNIKKIKWEYEMKQLVEET